MPGRARDLARQLADEMRREPELFVSVFLPEDDEFFERNGLMYLSVAELEALSDRLTDAQPLLGLIKQRGNGAGVIDVIARTIEAEGPAANRDQLDVLYAELSRVLDSAATDEPQAMRWGRLVSLATPAGSRSMLLVQPQLDFSRVQPARPAIERMRALADELAAELDHGVSLRLTGTLAMEHEELGSVSRGAGLAGLAALVLVVAVLAWALRSPVLVTVSIATLLIGLCGTAAFAAAAVGQLNLLSVAFAVLYIGLGVDFILHICLRLKELLAEGQDLDTGLVNTMKGVGTSLVICAVTTAAGFYSFIPTSFEGVAELGLISGTGMFVSLLVSVSLLPALIREFYAPRPGNQAARLSRAVTARGSRLAPRFTVTAAGLLALAAGASLPWVRFDSNPVNLRDPETESVQLLEELAASSSAEMLSLVAVAPSAETAAAWAAELESLSVVGDVVTVDSLVPAEQREKKFLLDDIELVLGADFGKFAPAEPEPTALLAELRGLAERLAEKSSPSEAERRLAESLSRLLAGLGEGRQARERLVTLSNGLIGDLPAQLESLEEALQAEPFGKEALPPVMAERGLDDSGRALIEIVPAENVNENAAAGRFVDTVRAVLPSATGLPVVHREASRTVVASFRLALAYAFVLVSIILVVLLRSIRDAAMVLAPILFAAVVTAGATAWLGLPFNFANIIALPLLVGVGVDNGIHMVHRMRTEPPRDGEPLNTSTSKAVLASGLTTIASFGNLAFSSHVGMASMGQLLTLGMLITLVGTLILLPAIFKLRSPA
jgi:hopanoid biosynthesis associated RND transporter like protein HpnN